MKEKRNLGLMTFSWQIVSLVVLFLGLLIGLLLVKKRQEIRKKAHEEVCTLSFDETAISTDKWRRITSPAGGKYQIITSGNNSVTLIWSCPQDYPVNTFRVKDGQNDITIKCSVADSSTPTPCNLADGCNPQSPYGGKIICSNLEKRQYQFSLQFTR